MPHSRRTPKSRGRARQTGNLKSARDRFIQKTMHKWGAGTLHSGRGGAHARVVPHTPQGQRQAVRIGFEEWRAKH
jgi:hypothetical protein